MRARRAMVGAFLLALAGPVAAGDGDKPAAPAAPDAKKPAETKSAEPKAQEPKAAAQSQKDKDAAAKDEEKRKADVAKLLARPAPRDLDEAMRRLARVRVSVTFKETPFTEAVDYVRRVAGFNVIVAPALQVKGVDGIHPLTMALTDVSLRQVVDLLAQMSGTKLKFADDILQFTTPQDARGKPVLRIYAIGDVTMPIRNFPGPDLNLRPAHAEFEEEKESDVPGPWSDPDKLVETIQKLCGEDTWTDTDVSISADQNKLIVRQYPEVQREIARLIMLLRASR